MPTCRFSDVSLPFFPTSQLSLMALPLVCFTNLPKSKSLPPWGHLSYENAAVDDDKCFNQLAYCSEQVVEPWGTVACERQSHNLNDYSSRDDKDSWLRAVSCWGLLSEKSDDRWLEKNIYKLRMVLKHQTLTIHRTIIQILSFKVIQYLFNVSESKKTNIGSWFLDYPCCCEIIWFKPC